MGQLAGFARSPIGIFVFSEKDELVYFRLFSRNPEKAYEEFRSEKTPELKGYTIIESPGAYMGLRKNFRDYAKSLGFVDSDKELNEFLSSFFTIMSKNKLVGAIGRDRLLVQAISAVDDMNRIVSLFHERLYEWYSLHYPEMRNTRDLPERIMQHRRRENFPEFASSTGADLDEKDEKKLVEFSRMIHELKQEKDRLEQYVAAAARDMAPNLSLLVDPLMAARLIAQAGSLEKLARMPASTIQLLGAEKALFRHLKKKGRSPKYGILYTVSFIQNAPPEKRGKVARLLSAQLMKASKIDFYSGRLEARLKDELDEELRKI